MGWNACCPAPLSRCDGAGRVGLGLNVVLAAVRELLEGLRGVGDDERRTLWRDRIAGSVFHCSNAALEWQGGYLGRRS